MRTLRVSSIVVVTSLVFLLAASPLFAAPDPCSAEGIYGLTKAVIKAGQMGLQTYGQERTFWDGIAAYSKNDMTKARQLLSNVSEVLNWEIANKRALYTKKFVSANDVVSVTEQGGGVQIWPLMSSENGDFEWAKAVSDDSVDPGTVWRPPTENVEKGIAVVYGRGTITVNGQTTKVFGGDIVAVPPNMPFR